MAKKVHMVKEVVEAASVRSYRTGEVIYTRKKHAETICGIGTRSMKNATYDAKQVTCQYCLGRLGSKVNG